MRSLKKMVAHVGFFLYPLTIKKKIKTISYTAFTDIARNYQYAL